MKQDRLFRLFRLLALLSFTICLLFLWQTPLVSGYEMSIYNSLPSFFWISITLALSFSITMIFYSFKNNSMNKIMQSFILILIIYFLLLILPTVRGYKLYSSGMGDILVHIGRAKSIVENGVIGGNNIYPITHLLLAYFNFIGISFEISANILGAFFSLFFIFSIFVLGRNLLPGKNNGFFILIFAIPLYFSMFQIMISHPAVHSLFTLPLIIFCYEKMKRIKKSTSLLFVSSLLILNLLFFHPMTILFAIIIFIVYFLVKVGNGFLKITKEIITPHIRYFIFLTTLAFITWLINISRLIVWTFSIFRELIYPKETTQLEHYTEMAAEADVGIITTLRVIFFRYFPNLLLIILGLILLLILSKKIFSKKTKPSELNYGAQFFLGLIIGFSFIVGYFIEFDPIRVSRYAILMGIIFIGLMFHSLYNDSKRKKQFKVLFVVFIIVLGSCIIGIFNIYAGPNKGVQNRHRTEMDIRGLQWYISNRDPQISFVSNHFDLRKIEMYILGYENYLHDQGDWDQRKIPTHFGYHKNATLAETFQNESRYVVTNENLRKRHLFASEEARPEVPHYLDDDFKNLEKDVTVNKIYENGEFELWRVRDR